MAGQMDCTLVGLTAQKKAAMRVFQMVDRKDWTMVGCWDYQRVD